MNTYLTTGDKKTCLGCLACVDACPRKIIQIQEEHGFYYPKIKEPDSCIQCNICKQVCPYDNQPGDLPMKAFAFKNTEEVRSLSASGGAFTAISDALMNVGYRVYGCVLDNNFSAIHVGTEEISVRNKMRGSKYVASDIRGVFNQVKQDLDQNKGVLFTGTPCQVSGLKLFLRKDYTNLFTVDFICHGVSSPALFKDYLQLTGSGSEVINVIFRDKRYFDWRNEGIRVYRKDGTISQYESSYMKMFTRGFGFRDSCGVCPYAKQARTSDITIGDFWSIGGFAPEMEDTVGVSVVLINGQKGEKLFQKIEGLYETKECDVKKLANSAPHLNHPASPSVINDFFWKKYKVLPREKFFSIFGGDSLKSKLIRKPREYLAAIISRMENT